MSATRELEFLSLVGVLDLQQITKPLIIGKKELEDLESSIGQTIQVGHGVTERGEASILGIQRQQMDLIMDATRIEVRCKNGDHLERIQNVSKLFFSATSMFEALPFTEIGYNFVMSIKVEDTAEISCELENGATGIIDVSWTTPVPAKSYLEIYGEEGTLLLDFKGLTYKLKTWDEWRRISFAATARLAKSRERCAPG